MNPRRIVFLCSANSCRSQMAEAMLRYLGGEGFEACSAGLHPVGFIHPLAQDVVEYMSIPMAGQGSKGCEVYDAASVDAVVSLCDTLEGHEEVALWREAPIRAHWPTPDPVYHHAKPRARFQFALTVGNRLREKIGALVRLDWDREGEEIERELQRLGEL